MYLKTHPVSCKAILTAVNEYCLNICVPTYDFRSVHSVIITGNIAQIAEKVEGPKLQPRQLRAQIRAARIRIRSRGEDQTHPERNARSGHPADSKVRIPNRLHDPTDVPASQEHRPDDHLRVRGPRWGVNDLFGSGGKDNSYYLIMIWRSLVGKRDLQRLGILKVIRGCSLLDARVHRFGRYTPRCHLVG